MRKDWDLWTALSVFCFMTTAFIVPDILFFFYISINPGYFILSIFCTLLLLLYFTRNWKKSLFIISITLILVTITIFISYRIIDTSYDGNGYRKIMTGFLKEGWNPVQQTAEQFNQKIKAVPEELSYFGNRSNWFWMDVYPKSLGIFGAVIYSFFGKIETGKCFTLLSMICVFLAYNFYLRKHIKCWQSIFISLCLALNPVSMTQLRTFYVDAFLGNIILLAIIFMFIYFDSVSQYKTLILSMIDLCIIWAFNIKFNGIFFIGTLCIIFWLIYLLKDMKQHSFIESKKIFMIFGGDSMFVNFRMFALSHQHYKIS